MHKMIGRYPYICLSFQNSHSRKNWIVSQPDELNKKRVVGVFSNLHQSSIYDNTMRCLRRTSSHKLATLISSWIASALFILSAWKPALPPSEMAGGQGLKFHPISFTELPKMEVLSISKTHGIFNWYIITQNATESVPLGGMLSFGPTHPHGGFQV